MENEFFPALDNDLNTSKALGALFDFIKKANPILAAGMLDLEQKKYIIEALEKINAFLNILKLQECPLTPEIFKLLSAREEARRKKDWKKADDVREELARLGIKVVDTATGPVWQDVNGK